MSKLPPTPPSTEPRTDSPVSRRATIAWLVLVVCVLLGVALYVAYGRDLLPLTTDVP